MTSINFANGSARDRVAGHGDSNRDAANGPTVRSVNPRVSVIILHWNRPDDTLACLRSLGKSNYSNLQVTLVDNGSESSALARLKAGAADVAIIENGRNLGFAGGNNVAIARALTEGADYVLLLNDDTEVAPDLVRKLVETAEQDPAIGMVGPKIYYFEPRDVVWSAGGMVDRHGEPRHLGVDKLDKAVERSQDVDYVTGCAILVKREVVQTIGMLDERFFAYFEETEWCARARSSGFRIVYVPSARMWHKISATERGYSAAYLYLMTRNRLLYLHCIGASPFTIARAAFKCLRTVVSWYLRPRHRVMRPFAGAVIRGLRDFAIGRFGAPPAQLTA